MYFDRNATKNGAKRSGSDGMHRRPNAAWVLPQAVNSLWCNPGGPVAVKMPSRRDADHRDGSAGKGTPTSRSAPLRKAQRDRASPTAKKRGDGLERRPPAGIARERETSADDSAPCQHEGRTLSQHRCRDRSPLPLPPAAPFHVGGVCRRTRSWRFLPVGAPPSRAGRFRTPGQRLQRAYHAMIHTGHDREYEGPACGRCGSGSLWQRVPERPGPTDTRPPHGDGRRHGP